MFGGISKIFNATTKAAIEANNNTGGGGPRRSALPHDQSAQYPSLQEFMAFSLKDKDYSPATTNLFSLLIAAACMAEGGVIMKGYTRINPIVIAAIATTVGTIIIIALSLLNKEPWLLPSSPQMWWVMAYLTIGASVIPLLLYLYILKRWPASAAIYPMVLMPFVTVLLATSLTDERVTWEFILGGLLVVIAVWFGAIMVQPIHLSRKSGQMDH